MTGIAGITSLDGQPVTQEILDGMRQATPHIGPDGVGSWVSGPVGMLRFHLWTTPEAVGEVQPRRDPDSDSTITFDGRIDNRAELLSLLERRTDSPEPDCSIVLKLFNRFGDDCVQRLTGDYAFAIWSGKRQRMFCARSPVGFRTLLWAQDGKRFAFASQPRTLVEGLSIERRLNEGAVGEYLSARFVTQTETFFVGINRLPGGGALAVEDGRVRTWHWHNGPFEDWSNRSEADHVDRFRELFDQALQSVMRSDRTVMAQLSGGLDSSTVVSRATQLHRAGRIDRQVGVITVRYPGQQHDEGAWSGVVESEYGLTADVATPDHFSLDDQRSWCAETLHLPLRPNVMTAMNAPMQARNARVLLTGEGGDDWLGGSHGHWPDLLLRGQWGRLLREATAYQPLAQIPRGMRRILLDAIAPVVSERARARHLRPHLDFGYEPPPWIRADWANRIGLSDRWRADRLPNDLPDYSQRQRYHAAWLARRHVNMDNALALGNAQGIEWRHPFHDIRLTGFLMGASGEMLRRGRVKKYLLRQAMRGTLPEKIRTRPDKASSVVTIIDAVGERLRERPVEDLYGVRMGWIDGKMLQAAHTEHLAWRETGFARNRMPKMFYGPVWFTISMDLWLDHAFKL